MVNFNKDKLYLPFLWFVKITNEPSDFEILQLDPLPNRMTNLKEEICEMTKKS